MIYGLRNVIPTWRIIPFSKELATMVGTSPIPGVVGPLPNGLNGRTMEVTMYSLSGVILQVPPENEHVTLR